MICRNCGSDFPSDLRSCPKCRTSRDADALVLAGGLDTLDPIAAPLRAQLARVDDEFKNLLTLDADIGSPLSPGELMRVEIAEQPGTSITTLDELEKLLLGKEGQGALDGIPLKDLLDKGGKDLEIIKRGLTFLKHRKYSNALEWWSLHREALDVTQQRFELLLLMLEAFTHDLAGDKIRAIEVRTRAKKHPLFEQAKKKR